MHLLVSLIRNSGTRYQGVRSSISAILLLSLTGAAISMLPGSVSAQDADPAPEPTDAVEPKPVETLENFIQTLNTFEAEFEQTLYGADEEPLSTSTGSMKLKRPAKFLWEYTTPQPQLIIADGEKIWLYDEDLEQVTVSNIDDRINGTPLQLLMGTVPLSDGFAIETLGQADGIDWFELTPLEESADFEQVFIGLSGGELAAMELRDTFGQATQIRLENFNDDVDFDDSVFDFEVPDGVDVIGLDE